MASEYGGYVDAAGNVVLDTDPGSLSSWLDTDEATGMPKSGLEDELAALDEKINKSQDLERAAELKRKELYRKTDDPLQYNDDGTLETDSNTEIRAKEAVNALSSGVDWLLEATENIYDAGQGDWLNNAKVDAVIEGKNVNMSNKDIIAARNTNLQNLIDEYNNAEYNPNADKAVYTLRKFDGYDAFGNPKYLYKYGVAETSAADRYKNQWVQDGFDIVDEKRFLGAEKWENTLHALQSSLRDRALDYGGVVGPDGKRTSTDKASGVNFGAGYTELYNRDLLGNDAFKTQEDYDKNLALSQYLMEQRNKTRVPGSNAIDAFQSGLLTTAAGIGDFALDLITPGDNTLLNKYADSEWADKFVGYDRTETNQAMEEALHSVKNGDIFSALGRVKDFGPELFAESLPYMATFMFGAGEAALAGKAAQMFGVLAKAKKLGKSASTISKIEKRIEKTIGKNAMEKYKNFENAPHLINKLRALSKNYGVLAINGVQTNNAINDRVKAQIENGEEPDVSIGEALGIYAFQLPFTLLDKVAFEDTVVGKGAMKQITKAMDFVPDNKKLELGKKVLETGAKILAGSGEEAAQEYFQTWGELLSAKVGINGQSIGDVLMSDEANKQAQLGAIGGFGAGAVPSVFGSLAGKTFQEFNKKRIAKAIEKQNANDPLNAAIGYQGLEPGSSAAESKSHMDQKINEVVPFVEPLEDGTYDTKAVKEEVDNLYKKIIAPIREHVAKAYVDEKSVKDMNLGSSKVAIRRMKNALKKFNGKELTPDEQKFVDNSWQEVKDFEGAVNSLFEQKIKNYSINEIDNMTGDQLILEFGAEDENDAESDVYEDAPWNDPKYQKMADDAKAKYDFEEDEDYKAFEKKFNEGKEADIDAELENDAKKAIIASKVGNKKETFKTGRALNRKAKIKQTLQSIMDRDLFSEDKGLIARAARVLEANNIRQDIKAAKKDVVNITKEFMIKNGYGASENKTVDDITDAEVEHFISKDNKDPLKLDYYKMLNANKIKSIHDHDARLRDLSNQQRKLGEAITKKLTSKERKKILLQNTNDSMQAEIEARYEELKNNGIPIPDTSNNVKKLGEKKAEPKTKKNPTDEEIMSQLELEFGSKKKKIDSIKFEIYYKDILDNMLNQDKEEYSPSGVFKLLKTIDSEIKTLNDFIISSDGTIKLSKQQEKSLDEYRAKEEAALNAEINKLLNQDINVLNPEKIKSNQAEIERLQRRLIQISGDVDSITKLNEKGDLTVFQEELIKKLEETGDIASDIYREYLKVKNQVNNNQKELSSNNKRLKQIDKDLRKLYNEQRKLVLEVKKAHENEALNPSLDNMTWIERAQKIVNKMTMKMAGILRGYGAKLKEIKSIQKQIDALTTEKSNIENENKNIEKKNIPLKIKKGKLELKLNKIETGLSDKLDEKEKGKADRKRKLKQLLIRRINRLKKDTEAPALTVAVLLQQAKSVKPDNKYSKEGIPNTIAEYTTVSKVASSLLSKLPPRLINNKTLSEYSKKAISFYQNSGIQELVEKELPYGDLPNEKPFMALLTDEKGNLNESVITAVILAAEQTIRNKSGIMYYRSDEEIARMLGINENDLTPKQKREFRQKTRRANLANEIGNTIMQMLDMKQKQDGDQEAFERLKTSAGLIGIKYLIDTNVIEEDNMPIKKYNEVMGIKDTARNKEGELATFVSLKKGKDKKPMKVDEKIITKLKEDFVEMEKDQLIPRPFASVQFKPGKPKTAEERGIQGNDYMQPTQEVADALNASEQQEHEMLINSVKNLIDNFTEEEALRLIGWLPEEEIDADTSLTFNQKENKKAANMEKESAYRELLLLHDELDNGIRNDLWFRYFTPRNNRLNIDSVLISPQTEKELHRWLITPKQSKTRLTKSDIIGNKQNALGFKFGVAQAFGFDIDKETVKDTIAFADEILSMKPEALMAAIKAGEFDHLGHALQALEAVKEFQNNKFVVHTTLTAEYDGITNGTILKTGQLPIAANAAEILFKGGFVFRNVSNKGVSNPMAIKYQKGVDYANYDGMLSELGNAKKIRDEAIKKEQAGEEVDDFGNVLDVYFTQALAAKLSVEDVSSVLKKAMEKDKYPLKDNYGIVESGNIFEFIPEAEGNLSKALREMFKFPTMMINYGSAINTVVKNVSNDAVQEMYGKLLTDYTGKGKYKNDTEKEAAKNKAEKILQGIVDYHKPKTGKNKDFSTVDQLVKLIQTEHLDRIGSKINGKFVNIEDNLLEIFSVAVGSAVGEAINDTFGDMINITEATNNNSRYMFRVFEQALEQDINAYIEEEKKKGNDTVVMSPEVLFELTMKNKKFLPIFEGPATEERLKDGIAIFSSTSTSNADLQYGDKLPKVAWMVGDKQKSMNSRIFVKKIAEAYSSAGVLPTHTEDAVDMSKLINKVMKKYGLTHIHDAIAIGSIDVGTILKEMNKIIGETSRDYYMLNNAAKAMREIYEEAMRSDKNIDLSEMRTESEIKQEKKRAKQAGREYEPLSYLNELIKMENLAESVWMAKSRLYSNDVKVDQMPGPKSVHTMKAKYVEKDHIDELVNRIKRRLVSLDDGAKQYVDSNIFGTNEKKIRKNVKAILKSATKDITGPGSTTKKINASLDIIETITKVLNGEC